jgi:hypothetical protein
MAVCRDHDVAARRLPDVKSATSMLYSLGLDDGQNDHLAACRPLQFR